ncbi:16S rRNA (guanine(527)-N(7))-methyltransferase RsmG [Helicovermis profundi]|uniref:Ribosomal RNA small subunit methyltransferase G n=1 Tax=Helicovermis profundi TaxID=3065157 RepID=A0AAU9EA89_9FIRM|nr:16S rRNA (guanine(527)-N(7))-methyltransferase RsmG [Clostridia bacterium S502]
MNYEKIMQEGLEKYHIKNDEYINASFLKYRELIKEWNKKINLTSITEDEEIATKHFIDSIATILTEKIVDNVKVIDVGTGAGFPGIPLKIVNRSIDLTLLDSLKKRIDFLKIVADELNLDKITCLHGRAEDYGKNISYREKYDISISRAVANLSSLAEYCLPFVKIGGYFISLKGPKALDEIRTAENAINKLGGKIEGIIKVDLMDEEINHQIIVIKKITNTPKKFPRKAGLPSKKPL